MWVTTKFVAVCPNCGQTVDRDEVNVEVGIIYGPYGCFECGWTEWTDPSKAGHMDPHGGYWPDGTIQSCFMDGREAIRKHIPCGEAGVCEERANKWTCVVCNEVYPYSL